MREPRFILTRVEREQEMLRIAETLAQRGFYVFGQAPAKAAPATSPDGASSATWTVGRTAR